MKASEEFFSTLDTGKSHGNSTMKLQKADNVLTHIQSKAA